MICFLHRRNVSWWTVILTVLTGSAKVLNAPKRRHMDCKKFEWLTEDICKEYQKRADLEKELDENPFIFEIGATLSSIRLFVKLMGEQPELEKYLPKAD